MINLFLFVIFFTISICSSKINNTSIDWFTCPIFETIPLELTESFDFFDAKSVFVMNSNSFQSETLLNLFQWNSSIQFESHEKHYSTNYNVNRNIHIGECAYMKTYINPLLSDSKLESNTNYMNMFVKRKLGTLSSSSVLILLLSGSSQSISVIESIGQTLYQELSGTIDIYYLYHRGITKYSRVSCPPFDKDPMFFTSSESHQCQTYIKKHYNELFTYFTTDNAAYDLYTLIQSIPEQKNIYIFASNYNTIWTHIFQQWIPSFDSTIMKRIKGIIYDKVPFYYNPYQPRDINLITDKSISRYLLRCKENNYCKNHIFKEPMKIFRNLLSNWVKGRCSMYMNDAFRFDKNNKTDYIYTYEYIYTYINNEKTIYFTQDQLKRLFIYIYASDIYRPYFFPILYCMYRCTKEDIHTISLLTLSLYSQYPLLPDEFIPQHPLYSMLVASYVQVALKTDIYKQDIHTDIFFQEAENIYRYKSSLDSSIPISIYMNKTYSSNIPILLLYSELSLYSSSFYSSVINSYAHPSNVIINIYKYISASPFFPEPSLSTYKYQKTRHSSPAFPKGLPLTCGERDTLTFLSMHKSSVYNMQQDSACIRHLNNMNFDGDLLLNPLILNMYTESSVIDGYTLNNMSFNTMFIISLCIHVSIIVVLLCTIPNCYMIYRIIRRYSRKHHYMKLSTIEEKDDEV